MRHYPKLGLGQLRLKTVYYNYVLISKKDEVSSSGENITQSYVYKENKIIQYRLNTFL